MQVELQVNFSTFFKRGALRRAQDVEKILESKPEKLYTVYDSLLNILNKIYVCIFQRANADQNFCMITETLYQFSALHQPLEQLHQIAKPKVNERSVLMMTHCILILISSLIHLHIIQMLEL